MRRPHHLLLATILATTLLGSATAEGETTTEPIAAPFSVLANTTISCSAAWPSTTVGCWIERPILVIGPLELAIALDAQVAFSSSPTYLAPMLSLAWYGEVASAWLEATLPEGVLGLPHVGRGDWIRLGFSYRWPP